MVDLAPFVVFDVSGPGALDYLQTMTVNSCNVAVGRSVYTPLLDYARRLPQPTSRSCAWARRGSASSPAPSTGHATSTGSARTSPTTARSPSSTARPRCATIGVWGPEARDLVSSVTDGRPLRRRRSPTARRRRCCSAPSPVRLFRISYVGDLGWEIYVPMRERAGGVGPPCGRPARTIGVVAVGAGVYGTSGRLEKGYRLMGAELGSEYNPVEAGLARPKVKSADFIGKEAYLAAREAEPAAILCTLTVEDHVAPSDGIEALHDRQRADPHAVRRAHRRPQGPAVLRHVGRRRAVRRQVPAAGLPPAASTPSSARTSRSCTWTSGSPVRVAVAGSTPLFDPDDARMKS